MVNVDIGEHEQELARALYRDVREYQLADWATTNLAVALHAAGQLSPLVAEPERSLRRTLLVSSARLFRLARSGMAVVAVGYESEARAFDRGMIETRARCMQALEDDSGEVARTWPEGVKLRGSMTEAIRKSFPAADPNQAKMLYGSLSGDVHPDLAQLMLSLVRERKSGGYEMGFSARRTPVMRRSLLLYAWLCAEAMAEVGERVGVATPHLDELHRALVLAGAHLQSDFRGGVPD